MNTPMVVGKPTTITYFMVNSGDASAKNVHIEDSFPRKAFKGIDDTINSDGSVMFNIDELGIGKTISFNCTIIPQMEGIYSSNRAEITYYDGSVVLEDDEEYDEEDQLFGYSSSLGQLYILSENEAHFNSFSIQWKQSLMFLLFGGISVLVPGMAWRTSPKVSSELL